MSKRINGKAYVVRRYGEWLKRQVVEDIERGCLTVKEAMEWYDVPWRRTIDRWRQQYGKNSKTTRVVRIFMKSEQERIRELEKLVADLEIENRVKSAQLEIIEEWGLEEDIKKKLNTQQLKEYEERKKRIKSL
ncbi:MAG: transposase [Bdellovibrionales bacterium]|nr:transposase [Bdellovibrionales bacterium]